LSLARLDVLIEAMKKLFRKLLPGKPSPKRKITFLHIGKNAGTEIKRYTDLINENSEEVEIQYQGHDFFLRNLLREDQNSDYFFAIRDPISRFKSAFYGRKRQGRPRYTYAVWSRHEALAFRDFEHANDLAEALFRRDETGLTALAAIKSIRHTAQNQIDWFYCCGNFLELRPPVAIIRQSNFKEDMRSFQLKIGLPDPFFLAEDSTLSHRNNYDGTPALSPEAIDKLKRWYAQDFEFYEMCVAWINRGGNSNSMPMSTAAQRGISKKRT
jgi:hypothetical protein